jgi:hypothetical protein
MLFTSEECLVFERYPNSASWKDVSVADQAIFKEVWTKLKALSNKLAESSNAPIPLKAFTFHYVPNGRSPKEIWKLLCMEVALPGRNPLVGKKVKFFWVL